MRSASSVLVALPDGRSRAAPRNAQRTASRTVVERDVQPVAGVLDLDAAELADASPQDPVVHAELLEVQHVAEAGVGGRRADDVVGHDRPLTDQTRRSERAGGRPSSRSMRRLAATHPSIERSSKQWIASDIAPPPPPRAHRGGDPRQLKQHFPAPESIDSRSAQARCADAEPAAGFVQIAAWRAPWRAGGRRAPARGASCARPLGGYGQRSPAPIGPCPSRRAGHPPPRAPPIDQRHQRRRVQRARRPGRIGRNRRDGQPCRRASAAAIAR